jgi:hypothetical protein
MSAALPPRPHTASHGMIHEIRMAILFVLNCELIRFYYLLSKNIVGGECNTHG